MEHLCPLRETLLYRPIHIYKDYENAYEVTHCEMKYPEKSSLWTNHFGGWFWTWVVWKKSLYWSTQSLCWAILGKILYILPPNEVIIFLPQWVWKTIAKDSEVIRTDMYILLLFVILSVIDSCGSNSLSTIIPEAEIISKIIHTRYWYVYQIVIFNKLVRKVIWFFMWDD